MAAHRKVDRTRVDLCAGVLRKYALNFTAGSRRFPRGGDPIGSAQVISVAGHDTSQCLLCSALANRIP
jgi:hypothetical protein